MQLKATEHQIQNAILGYLNSQGHYCWRNNSGMVHMRDKYGRDRMWKAGLKGSSDIIGIATDGRFIAIECKRKGKKPTPQQEAFLQEIKQRGGYAGIATSIEDTQVIMNHYETTNNY